MSRQEAINSFTGGLVTDTHPINTSNEVLTDCLNGTLITYNGNENSLQNDRGNYSLRECSLPKGFMPLGTAEYGDILYIVSYNPDSKEVEIGTYPSTNQYEYSDIGSSPAGVTIDYIDDLKGKYSELCQKFCQLQVFSGMDPLKWKIYPGDQYILMEETKARSPYQSINYYLMSEDKNLYDINDLINKFSKEYTINPDGKNINPEDWKFPKWQIPGWIAAKLHIADIDNFEIGLRSLVVKNVEETTGDVTAVVRCRVTTSDPLLQGLTTSPFTFNIEGKIGKPSVTPTPGSSGSYVIGNGSTAYYQDYTFNFTGVSTDNSTFTVTATPMLDKIIYDKFTSTFTFKVRERRTPTNLSIGGGVWKYCVFEENDSNIVSIDFSTEGLNSIDLGDEFALGYDVKEIEGGTKVVELTEVTDWFPDKVFTTHLNIPCAGDFKKENIYVITFYLCKKDNGTIAPVASNVRVKKLLITSELFNDFYSGEKATSNYDDLTFDDWIVTYKNHVKDTDIKIIDNGGLKLIDEDDSNNSDDSDAPKVYIPQITTIPEGAWGSWLHSNEDSVTYSTLLSKSAYNKVKEQNLKYSFIGNYTKDYEVTCDPTYLTGDLWGDQPTISLRCNYQNIGSGGRVTANGSFKRVLSYDIETLSNNDLHLWTIEKYDDTEKMGAVYEQIDTNITDIGDTAAIFTNTTVTSGGGGKNWVGSFGNLSGVKKQLETRPFIGLLVNCTANTVKSVAGGSLQIGDNKDYSVTTKNDKDHHKMFSKHYVAIKSKEEGKLTVFPLTTYDYTSDDGAWNMTKHNGFKAYLETLNGSFVTYVSKEDVVDGGFIKAKGPEYLESSDNYTSEVICDGYIQGNKASYGGNSLLTYMGREDIRTLINNIDDEVPINTSLLSSYTNYPYLFKKVLEPNTYHYTLTKSDQIAISSALTAIDKEAENIKNMVTERNNLIQKQYGVYREHINEYSWLNPGAVSIKAVKDTAFNSSNDANLFASYINQGGAPISTNTITLDGYWWILKPALVRQFFIGYKGSINLKTSV